MIKIEKARVYGWDESFRGMRNPYESWDKSDSEWEFVEDPSIINPNDEVKFVVGENDLDLTRRLVKGGTDHSKFTRFLDVGCDIVAPLYWWKEFDTYRVGVEKNSCSTMHRIHAKEFTLDDFSHEHLLTYRETEPFECVPLGVLEYIIGVLNENRLKFIGTNNKKYWWQMIQLLPLSYNQRRTVKMSYQALQNMYHARKHHKLDEWREFCKWVETLPYFKEMILDVD